MKARICSGECNLDIDDFLLCWWPHRSVATTKRKSERLTSLAKITFRPVRLPPVLLALMAALDFAVESGRQVDGFFRGFGEIPRRIRRQAHLLDVALKRLALQRRVDGLVLARIEPIKSGEMPVHRLDLAVVPSFQGFFLFVVHGVALHVLATLPAVGK